MGKNRVIVGLPAWFSHILIPGPLEVWMLQGTSMNQPKGHLGLLMSILCASSPSQDLGSCENYGPFLGPYNCTAPNI